MSSWRKSKASGSGGGQCVEIGATAAGTVASIRDSKAPERGHLAVMPNTFRAFLERIKSGELDL
jgi:hypothetical protein